MIKVFLGGTCNESTWRERLISKLDKLKVNPFNPVVDDWTPECQKKEEQEKKISDYRLYCITPLMTGVFSIAEVVDDSNKFPEKTILVVLFKDDGKSFDKGQIKSLQAVMRMVKKNGGVVFDNLVDCSMYLNKKG